MTLKEKAKELVEKMSENIEGIGWQEVSRQCALIAVDRNIQTFNDLVNRMDDFSNESRQVIYQLIEDEKKLKREIKKL